ncbi:toxin-antitoxin system YwqK family antitoxin [Chryseobacterium sp. A321]
MKSRLLIFAFTILVSSNLFSQNINLDEYEIYIGDTLIAKSEFLENGQFLPAAKAERLEFKPIKDGHKSVYYLNGKIHSKGEIKNLTGNGIWTYWHSNGEKAREGEFVNGKPNGTHEYWYETGQIRAIGNWKNGIYDGLWEIYSKDGKGKEIQNYKEGKRIE